jgi:hypothetical protein
MSRRMDYQIQSIYLSQNRIPHRSNYTDRTIINSISLEPQQQLPHKPRLFPPSRTSTTLKFPQAMKTPHTARSCLAYLMQLRQNSLSSVRCLGTLQDYVAERPRFLNDYDRGLHTPVRTPSTTRVPAQL